MTNIYLFHFFVLITSFILGCTTHYIFDTETVKEILLVPMTIEPTEDILENSLHKLNFNEQQDLCENAKKFTPLGEVEPYKVIDPVDKYEVAYLDGTTGTVIGLTCSTEPVALLRVGGSDDRIRIMLEDQFLLPYSFKVEPAKSISFLGKDFPEETIRRHKFQKLNLDERRQLCSGARVFTSADETETSNVVDEAAGYEITYVDDEMRTSVALRCSTSPPLYLFLVNAEEVNIVSSNEFLDSRFRFSREVVESAVQQENQDFPTDYLYSLNGVRRWHLCIAARERDQILLPVHWIKPFESVALYDIQLSKRGGRTKRVAFKCSTSPKGMMLLTSNSEYDFVVMIVRNPNPLL